MMNITMSFTLRSAIFATLGSLLAITSAPAQQEIGYIEEFAFAQDRSEALKQLIPGTEDYYYFHALHYQNTRQGKELSEILTQWQKRFPNSGRRKVIENREALINYSNDPKKTLDYLRRELGLKFNHQQEGKARAQVLPSALDQAEVSWSKYLGDALRGTKTLNRLHEPAFFTLLADGHKLTGPQRRDLLSRATMPDLPGLVSIITTDLKAKESRGFGEFNIHRALTIAQLDELLAAKNDLIRNENFVHNYLAKLQPGADTNPATDWKVREAYLNRAWAFVVDLAPSFNSLKAHLLYQRLAHDRSRGVYDAGRFSTYLKLPRQVSYIRPEWRKEAVETWRHPADPGRDFRKFTGLPPIGGDEKLVRAYLLHLLKDAKDYKEYAPWLAENWLKAVFAETKIVNGIGDPERWASLLSPSAFQALKDRVDVEFAPNSRDRYGVDETVELRLHIKNVQTLIVKVFEVNTLNYYLERGTEVSTDLDLDGLVTNHERTVKYKDAPQRRIARDFEFPEIENRRGVWVVEFIGGSKSSRAVIRKGKVQVLGRTASVGEVMTILDEQYQPEKGAAVWFGGRKIACDDEGRALIPFSTDPGSRTAVIETSSGFAALTQFQHRGEQYALSAGIQVDRESLRPGAKATIVLRPSLTVANQPISLTRLEGVQLVLTSTDLDGVVSSATIPGFEIASDREATHEFRVPDRLASLQVLLRAKVKVASTGGNAIGLIDSRQFSVNAQLKSDRVDDLYLSRIDGDFVLEILGRTGEAQAGQNIVVTLRRDEFKNTHSVTLKTDANGGIELGALEGIDGITATAPNGNKRSWRMPRAQRTQPGLIHAVAGEAVGVPYFGALERSEVALLGFASSGYTTDSFAKLALKDGFLLARGLEPGDYKLLLKESAQAVTLRIAKGRKSTGHVFNEARVLELRQGSPAHLAALAVKGESLEILVANSDELTRVHITATRFLPEHDLFGSLGYAPQPGLYSGRPGHLSNLYLSGRKIGDEFRYILERRYAQKLPGNMLERPELLLNPWAVRDTESGEESLAQGEEYVRQKPGSSAKGGRGAAHGRDGQATAGSSSRSIDFLENAPAEIFNLKPDKDGKISIGLAAFGDRQHVHVLVVDPEGASYQELSLPDRNTAVRDLRLANALDPARHFTEQDSVTLLKKGDNLELPDILTAKFEVFDHLGSAYRYLLALKSDPTFREFGFVVDWPNLDDKEKRAKYSKYASHELSFFLAQKDPDFFKTVVRPHLANKKDKTFLDHYLLEAKLDRYFEPFEYNRLNALERILLAQQAKRRLDGIRLDLRDRLTLRPPNLTRETLFFDSALVSFALSSGRNKALQEGRAALGVRLGDDVDKVVNVSGSVFSAEGGVAAPAPDAPPVRDFLRRSKEKAGELSVAGKKLVASEAKEELGLLERNYKRADFKNRFDAYGEIDAVVDAGGMVFYRAIETTKEWAENNYYRLAIESHTWALITENKFWLDFARHEGDGNFGSRHLGEATRNVHEMLLALAVLDLPFTAPESRTEVEGTAMRFTAGGQAIAFHREIKEAAMADNPPPLLVSQSYFRHDDRHRIENGEKVDKFVTDEFVAGVVYGGQVVITNPTSSTQKLEVLIQIPKGAIPMLGHRATGTTRLSLAPYTTQRLEQFFYFPTIGIFSSYPAHLSKSGQVVGHADPFQFKVVDKPSKIDETSWAHISQWGTEEQVLAYLGAQNLHAIKLNRIAWRCRESAEFLVKALAALDKRGVYEPTLYSYGIHHDHAPAIRQYLQMQAAFLNSCGSYLKSELVTSDPIERRIYQHLEYKPLVNNRAHTVGGARKILNQRIRTQYQQFLTILSQKASLDDEDQLSATYYLFLQDRATEAIERLDAVKVAKLPTVQQYDYFQAYAAFYQAKPAEARAIATKYASHPVNRWRERFAAVVAQADEIEGKAPQIVSDDNREQQQAARAAEEPALELKVDGSAVTLTYERLAAVQVNYYVMDLEFLFSTNPFVSSDGGGFSVVQPNKSERLQLADGKRTHTFELPREYQSRNVLVEVIGGGKKRSEAVFSNELQPAVSERFGILTVRHAEDGRALPASYVKVYALTKSGPVFYKDGYTDLRGKFDYASVSTSDIGSAQKFSILIMSNDHGATVLEAPVPQR
jgi:hypothetical protein